MPLIAGTKVRTGKPSYVEVSDADELLDAGIGFVNTDAEYKMAVAIFSQTPRVQTVAVCDVVDFDDLATNLAALRNSGKDSWYYLLITSRLKTEIAIADAYVNSLEKVGVFGTADLTVTSTGDRSVIVVSTHADEFPDAAIVGRCAAEVVGSITWDSKQLSGQKNSDVTMAQQTTLLASHFNLIREMGSVNVFWEGKTASGQYIDNIIGRDYLEARITETLQSLKINSKKIPGDGRGTAMIEASLRSTFRDAGIKGVIAAVTTPAEKLKSDMGDYQYKLVIPEWANIPFNDKANRKIPITFSATVGGGINTIEVNGVMGV